MNLLFGLSPLLAVSLGALLLMLAEAFGKALLSDPVWLHFAWIPTMEPVRRHPRFKEVMTEMNLVAYWRATRWPEHCRPLGERDFECF